MKATDEHGFITVVMKWQYPIDEIIEYDEIATRYDGSFKRLAEELIIPELITYDVHAGKLLQCKYWPMPLHQCQHCGNIHGPLCVTCRVCGAQVLE